MKRYFDLDKKQLINSPGEGGIVRSVSFIRGDIDPLEIVFLKAGAEVTDVTNIVAVIKEKPGESEPSLADCQTWTEAESTFTGDLNLQGVALNTLIAAKTSIALFFEITCFHAGQGPITADPVKCTVKNDLWRGTEGTPPSLPSPDEWLEARRPAPLALTAALPQDSTRKSYDIRLDGTQVFGVTQIEVNGNLFTCQGDPGRSEFDSPASLAALIAALDGIVNVQASGEYVFLSPEAYGTAPVIELIPSGPGITATESAPGNNGTIATALAQSAIVTHSDTSLSEWGALSLNPIRWLPRTAGIIKNRSSGLWERLFIHPTELTLQTEILPDQPD